eukprot:COSAG06_NODE_2320_length_7089_cov_5.139628_7_plen_52_part_00
MRRQQHQETKPKQVHHNRTENASLILYSTAALLSRLTKRDFLHLFVSLALE